MSILFYVTVCCSLFFTPLVEKDNQGLSDTRLQKIVLKDHTLADRVKQYADQNRAKFVTADVRLNKTGYLCKLSQPYFLNSLQDYPTRTWGQWNGLMLVLYSNSSPTSLCSVLDTTKYKNLLTYAKSFLPSQAPNYKVGNETVIGEKITVEGPEWDFKVDVNSEIWIRKINQN